MPSCRCQNPNSPATCVKLSATAEHVPLSVSRPTILKWQVSEQISWRSQSYAPGHTVTIHTESFRWKLGHPFQNYPFRPCAHASLPPTRRHSRCHNACLSPRRAHAHSSGAVVLKSACGLHHATWAVMHVDTTLTITVAWPCILLLVPCQDQQLLHQQTRRENSRKQQNSTFEDGFTLVRQMRL